MSERIVVNGEPREVAPGSTVTDLLAELELDPRTVAIERNGAVVSRGDYDEVELAGGDRIEIVRFVQGG